MISYIKLSTLEFPRHEGDIRLEHPEILESQTGDTFPCPSTYAPVSYVESPEIGDNQTLEQPQAIQDESGNWILSWPVRDLTSEEIQARKDYEDQRQRQKEQEQEVQE